jgi:phosphotriesterase-related protein
MKIETVCGPISPNALGITLSHEHLLIDMRCWFTPPTEASKKAIMNKRVKDLGIENLGMVRLDPMNIKDNLLVDEMDLAIKELKDFKKMGGNSLVELSLPGSGRDPIKLREISKKTKINVICGTGWYVVASHPPTVKKKSVDQLSDIMVRELTKGIANTGIKAGIIGELGCSQPSPYHPDEKKVIRAGVRAQKATGACMTIHPCLFDPTFSKIEKMGNACIDLVEKEGINLNKFFLSHADWGCRDLDYLRKMLDRGVTVSFDSFSANTDSNLDTLMVKYRFPSDGERILALVELCKGGYDRQVVVAHDVCLKMHLKRYGGHGYSYILKYIVPILEREGVSKKQIKRILEDNLRRLLAH